MNAFDGEAFDFNAFDVGGVEPIPTPVFGGGIQRAPSAPSAPITNDDEEMLMAWFMFMRQPHG